MISTLIPQASTYNFQPLHQTIQNYVEQQLVSGLAAMILKDGEVVDFKTWGYMDIETRKPMAEDAIFRLYSNTKIITSAAAMVLYDDGAFELDDPLAKYIPQFRDLRVLKARANDLDDTDPLKHEPTIRQLISHSAGFSYGLFINNPLDQAYADQRMTHKDSSLPEMIDKLAALPLAYQPGEKWQYSIGIDILAHLIEIWSGQTFIDFLKKRLFEPLSMGDTDFYVPESKHHRLATNYLPLDMNKPMSPGLKPCPDLLIGSVLQPKRFQSGGGGLVGTISDYAKFLQMLIHDGTWQGQRILSPATVALMHTNQLQSDIKVKIPGWNMPNTVFGLGFAIKQSPAQGEPDSAIGEHHWGGLAGTHSWISPRAGLAGLIFTQRAYGFWHPFSHDFKRLAYQIADSQLCKP